MISQINPQPGDRILDIGCGTGSLLIDLWRRQAGAELIGLDPDKTVLKRADVKRKQTGAEFQTVRAFLSADALPKDWQPNKIVSSLVLHQVPMAEKRRILSVTATLRQPRGVVLHIADYGVQNSWFMKMPFRNIVQRLDGNKDTQPNADGVLPVLMQ